MSDGDAAASQVAEEAERYLEQGNAPAAIALIREAQSTLDHPGLWHTLGVLLGEDGEDSAAIEAYTRAIAGGYDPSYANRGYLYEQMGRDDAAERDYRDALSKDPNDVTALVNLGTLCLELHRFVEARSLLERAAGLDPTANWQLVDVYLAEARPEDALSAADAAISAGESRAILSRAQALIALGRDPDEDLRSAVALGVAGAAEESASYEASRSDRPSQTG